MKTMILAGMAAFMAFTAFAPSASADPPKKEQSYEYKFKDDQLLGAGLGAMGQQITVLKLGRRDRLLRPRTQFVQEMLKSVENM